MVEDVGDETGKQLATLAPSAGAAEREERVTAVVFLASDDARWCRLGVTAYNTSHNP